MVECASGDASTLTVGTIDGHEEARVFVRTTGGRPVWLGEEEARELSRALDRWVFSQ